MRWLWTHSHWKEIWISTLSVVLQFFTARLILLMLCRLSHKWSSHIPHAIQFATSGSEVPCYLRHYTWPIAFCWKSCCQKIKMHNTPGWLKAIVLLSVQLLAHKHWLAGMMQIHPLCYCYCALCVFFFFYIPSPEKQWRVSFQIRACHSLCCCALKSTRTLWSHWNQKAKKSTSHHVELMAKEPKEVSYECYPSRLT